MDGMLYFDDLSVGDSWTSETYTVTEADVMAFAHLTLDFDRLHVDKQYAASTPFGKPIAHGLFGLSLLAGLSSTCPEMQTAAFKGIRDWSFEKPLFFGDTVHVVTQVDKLHSKNRRRGHVTWLRKLINQNGETTQQGYFDTIVAYSAVASRAA